MDLTRVGLAKRGLALAYAKRSCCICSSKTHYTTEKGEPVCSEGCLVRLNRGIRLI